ncbi:MAG: GNAT family N-acetyltransferase [Acidimicrobiales bacterium]
MDVITITESRPGEVLARLHQSASAEREYLFASRDARSDDLILVAWIGDEAVGYIATSDEPSGVLLIWEHVVVPDHRGHGIGERLLVEAVRRTPPGTLIEVDPMAELDQDRIADYYGRLGFERTASRSGLWATATDVMRVAARRHGRSLEIDTPISVIVDTKSPGVVTVRRDVLVAEAIALMDRHRIGALVLSSDGSRVEGILSERDIMRGLARDGAAFLGVTVDEAAVTDVVTCTTHDSVADVMERMTNRRIRHMPVTAVGSLVGIVSLGDVVSRRLRVLEGRATPA